MQEKVFTIFFPGVNSEYVSLQIQFAFFILCSSVVRELFEPIYMFWVCRRNLYRGRSVMTEVNFMNFVEKG
jgi:hypothetical protein